MNSAHIVNPVQWNYFAIFDNVFHFPELTYFNITDLHKKSFDAAVFCPSQDEVNR